MAINQQLLERMQIIMTAEEVVWTEKKMFGGTCFMVDNKMCFVTYKSGLMMRIAPEEEPGQCPVWLNITGGNEVKQLIEQTIIHSFDTE